MEEISRLSPYMFLGAARLWGMAVIFPLFTMSRLGGLKLMACCIAISTPIILSLRLDEQAEPLELGGALAFLLVKEAWIGLLIGLLMGLPFWIFQTVGDLIDHTRSATIGNVVDPVNTSDTTTSGTFLLVAALLYFSANGGLLMMTEVVFMSYEIWPAEQLFPSMNEAAYTGIKSVLLTLAQAAFLIAMPILLALFAIDLTLMLLGRMAGSLQIFDLSNTFKNTAFVFLLPVFMMFFHLYFERTIGQFGAFLATLGGVDGG